MKNDDEQVWCMRLSLECRHSHLNATEHAYTLATHCATHWVSGIGSLNLSIIVVVSSFSLLSLLPSKREVRARTQPIEDWKQHGSNCVLHLRARAIQSFKFEKGKIISICRWHSAARTHSRPSTRSSNIQMTLSSRSCAVFFIIPATRGYCPPRSQISFDFEQRKFPRLPNAHCSVVQFVHVCVSKWVHFPQPNERRRKSKVIDVDRMPRCQSIRH